LTRGVDFGDNVTMEIGRGEVFGFSIFMEHTTGMDPEVSGTKSAIMDSGWRLFYIPFNHFQPKDKQFQNRKLEETT